MDFSSVCRTCLSETDLSPIFVVNADDFEHYSNALLLTTGIKVEPTDKLPQNMCSNCMAFINKSLEFRFKCKDVENKLLEIHNSTAKSKLPKITVKKNSQNTIEAQIVTEHDTEDTDADIKAEYLDFDDLYEDDEEDKPLKYLIETDTEVKEENFSIHVDDGKNSEDVKEEPQPCPASEPPCQPVPTSDPRPKRVTCKLCLKDLSIRSIDAHMASKHPGADESKVKCELCAHYVTKQKLSAHTRRVHGAGLRCRCGAEFQGKPALIQHAAGCRRKRVAPQTGREMVECDICHKSMQRASLKMHQAVKHAGLGPVCEHCGRRFSNKLRLAEHCRSKHDYDKFKCTLCDFQTASTMALRNHLRRHRGEKPFACDTCPARFHAAYLLHQHKQSHRSEKLVKCDLCPASFKANNSLHMHKMSCHSRSRYNCWQCGRAYSCRHYLVKHLRQVHRHRGPVPPLQPEQTPLDIH